jgi:magnesium transporter
VWADVYDPDHDTLAALAEELGLNSWAVEDAVAAAERTKATVYKTHTFFTVYAVAMTEPVKDDESALSLHRISGFVLPRGLITVRLSPWFDVKQVSQRFDELGGQQYGVGSLVHGLLDVVVDGHFEAVGVLDDCIEQVEDALFEDTPTSGLQRKTFRLRKGSGRVAPGGVADARGRQRHPASPHGWQDLPGTRPALRRSL